jgi:hypothetical protein
MLRVVRPGGVVMLQEPAGDSWRVPAGASWRRLRALIRAGFKHRGGDFDAGRSLGRRLQAVLVDVRERRVAHDIAGAHPYASLPLAFAASLATTWRQAGLTEAAELDDLEIQVRRALARKTARATTFTLVQMWGRKPASDSRPKKRDHRSSKPLQSAEP